jgi:hypothetical protein
MRLEGFVQHASFANITEQYLIRDNVGTTCGSLVVSKDAAYPALKSRHRDVKIGDVEHTANTMINKEEMTLQDSGLGKHLRQVTMS